MGCKTLIKWPKQITAGLVEQLIKAEKDIQKAILIFDAATAEYTNGFRHDNGTFGIIISRLLSANRFKSAEDMLARMKDENCMMTEDIFLSMYRAYGRVHKPLDVVRIFQKMKDYDFEPTQKSYITVFSILVNENRLKTAFKFYRYMREKGIPPSTASLNILIKALCKNDKTMDAAFNIFREMPKHGCNPDSYTYGTIINGLCKLGRILEAKELFGEMEAKGCLPTVIVYTALIHGLCLSNDLDGATRLLEDMKIKLVEPNVFTYTCLMDGLCKSGRSLQAMELLEMMISERKVPNIITYSTLIHGLCREGKLREALEIFDKIKLQGLQPDAGLYWKIISLFCEINKFQEAANYLDEMVLSGVLPNRVTWSLHVKIHNTVVQGLCVGNDPNRAFQLYLSIRTRGISVEAETFKLLVGHFCKKGDLHKSARIIEEMVIDGCIPGTGTWTAVLDAFWDRRKAKEATELAFSELMTKLMECKTPSLVEH
ncbi:PREDICTED: pentatricopeptide repeat-containing protein At5g46100 [Ipomoea nil]|uniref:pentatricopeptide repeat-containing protein At5g46100 n=1 Tax=Ipomoea nil TaxID=35883 RepID=UPI000900DABE|nr:PREDICTED: pentatricopeptide repeat-containing protein At5g46100 [Ipomoea nil]XP_019168705.1 PREDICTED: pentatricopeptide repeat-containing protein At5g46100 [Ipomoea nil]XP_019168706.1 PREDICTED: pentatricopeptide repeat-containing protein At5g46100 [Ipomoea nil]